VKAITLHQPYASLIALGLKKFETRSWKISAPDVLVIHAAKRPMRYGYDFEPLHQVAWIAGVDIASEDLPLGVAVAVCRVHRCHRMVDSPGKFPGYINIDSVSELEKALGDWQPGRYAWELRDVVAIPKPIPAVGKQGLWNFPHPELLPELPPFKWGGNHAA
jgi:hypothetical protein